MEEQQNNCSVVQKELEIFQNILLDIFERRAILEEIESLSKGKIDQSNSFLRSYSYNYLRSQFIDLRKFFDNDNRVHSISFITRHLPEGALAKLKHKELYKIWEKNYAGLADKYFFHLERDYRALPEVPREEFDNFIDEINKFITQLVVELTDKNFPVPYLSISNDNGYLIEKKVEVRKFFKALQN